MTVNDMHIAIDLELNKLNSNLYDIILPQEKDYFLNRAQERLIKQYYSPKSNKKGEGFEMSQKRIDDLRKLLVPNYYDKTYLLPVNDFDYSRKLRFYFPDNYMFLASQRSKIYYSECGTITTTNNIQTITYYVMEVPYDLDFNMFYIKKDGVGTNYIDNVQYPVLNTLTSEERSLFIEFFISTWNSTFASTTGWTAYYSRYKGITSEGNIIFVVTGNTPETLVFGFEAEEAITITGTTTNYVYLTATGGQEIIMPNRFAQEDDVYAMQIDPFNKSSVNNGPTTIITESFIDVFINSAEFIVKEIAISYLRKPKSISLQLNQSCELAEHMHAEIVRDAVNLLLENFEASGRLQTSLGVEQTNE